MKTSTVVITIAAAAGALYLLNEKKRAVKTQTRLDIEEQKLQEIREQENQNLRDLGFSESYIENRNIFPL